MNRSKIIFFLACFAVSFFMVYAITFRQHAKQEELLHSEASVIHEEVLERFEMFMDSLISKGIVTSEYFSHGNLYTKKYEQLAQNILQNYDEILGINIVDHQGTIVRVYPYQENKASLGKKTQNLQFMKHSLDIGEEFWISPPFHLYQGPQGFVVYIPIRRDDQLMGWICPVISNERFFKKFMTANFLRSYELVIQDVESGLNYFSTSSPKNVKGLVKRQNVKIRGRELMFLSWPKKQYTEAYLWPLSIFMALIISFLSTYLFGLLEQKFHSNMQPDEAEQLLRISIQDASNGMILIQNQLELMKLGAGHISPERVSLHAFYITNLLEQIKILQRITNQDESTKLHKTPLFPLILEVTDQLHDSIEGKNIQIIMNQQELESIHIYAHKTLFKSSVLNLLFTHIIYHAGKDTQILIKNTERKHHRELSLIVKDPGATSDFKEKMKSERSLIGIKRVVELHQGKFTLDSNGTSELIFNLVLPLIK
ncbi:hypothetical protein ACJVC5_15960 [Peredibacter sp. HCB2-198]|uniref:hypothetical protein n=1 Tax=Peredibacter sp. HCB2-198 TaxID=3383025 RepID=UPI0038B59F63